MTFLSNKKLRTYWYKNVTQLILDLGATPTYYEHDGSLKHYELDTRAGILEIYLNKEYNLDGSANQFMSVFSRFRDVEAANRVFGDSRGVWAHHNPASGKFNIHCSSDESVKPCDRIPLIDEALEQVRQHFESVL